MRKYLTALIEEKGSDLEAECGVEGHIGLTWGMLVDFICECPREIQAKIRDTLVRIDFLNGDVFHYLHHLACGMVASLGLEVM